MTWRRSASEHCHCLLRHLLREPPPQWTRIDNDFDLEDDFVNPPAKLPRLATLHCNLTGDRESIGALSAPDGSSYFVLSRSCPSGVRPRCLLRGAQQHAAAHVSAPARLPPAVQQRAGHERTAELVGAARVVLAQRATRRARIPDGGRHAEETDLSDPGARAARLRASQFGR